MTEVTPAIAAHECRSGLADNAAVVAVVARPVVGVIVGVGLAPEGRRCDRARRADCAADYACGCIRRPETIVAMIDAGLFLLHPDRWRPCGRILRQRRRR